MYLYERLNFSNFSFIRMQKLKWQFSKGSSLSGSLLLLLHIRGSVSTGALGARAPINLEERVQCTRPENINVNLVFSIIIIKFKFEVNKLHIT